jgi:uncharacterized membrane protein
MVRSARAGRADEFLPWPLALLGAVVFFSVAVQGIAAGSVWAKGSISREKEPGWFWAFVVMFLLVGARCLLLGINSIRV